MRKSNLTSGERQVIFAMLLMGATTLISGKTNTIDKPIGVTGKGIALVCKYQRWDTPKRRMMRSLEERGYVQVTLAYKCYWYQLTLKCVSDIHVDIFQAVGEHGIFAGLLISAFSPEREYFGRNKAGKQGGSK